MRTVIALVFIASGCGGPALGGVPHPDNGVMAGGAAAAAAALTLADPHAADRKPEQRVEVEKKPVDVKEEVPSSVFDKLDGSASAQGSGHELARPHAKTADATGSAAPPAPAPIAPAGKKPVIPSPHDAVDPGHADVNNE